MCFNGIGNMYKVHAFHHRTCPVGTFGTKKQKKMKQQKNNYIAPAVKSVSFVVEVGSELSPKRAGRYSDDPNSLLPGTYQLENQTWTGR